ncbi:hypothetical protein 04086_4574 [Escherichia phage 04086]|nr:hypothetical protein 04086_4574 [Escherichia phage 04086]
MIINANLKTARKNTKKSRKSLKEIMTFALIAIGWLFG